MRYVRVYEGVCVCILDLEQTRTRPLTLAANEAHWPAADERAREKLQQDGGWLEHGNEKRHATAYIPPFPCETAQPSLAEGGGA